MSVEQINMMQCLSLVPLFRIFLAVFVGSVLGTVVAIWHEEKKIKKLKNKGATLE